MGRLQCELEVSANARKKGINVNLSEVVLFVGLGAIVGFAGGLFAIGGALIAIPLLTAAFGFSQHDSQGTAMAMALASASVTLVIYSRKKLLRVRDDLIMAASAPRWGSFPPRWSSHIICICIYLVAIVFSPLAPPRSFGRRPVSYLSSQHLPALFATYVAPPPRRVEPSRAASGQPG
jgi:Sulfite exporter TauE/SafE